MNYFAHAISIEELEKCLENLEKIKDMLIHTERRKHTETCNMSNKMMFYGFKVESSKWLKRYPKLVERLERMFQKELHKLVDLEYTAENYKPEILACYDDGELHDYMEDYIEDYVDDVCKVRYSEREMRGQ